MLPLKHVIKQRLRSKSLKSSILNHCIDHAPYASLAPSSSQSTSFLISQNDVASSFKAWFVAAALHHRHQQLPFDPSLNRIYQILSSPVDEDFSAVLSALNLPLSERLVLLVLRYGASRRDILPCLKFFDWAGHQPHFHHTRATFFAMFQTLKRADLKPLVLDFLDNFRFRRDFYHRVRFHDTLVIGYAIAGKPQNALLAFGRMRFIGLDLDSFAYHVLLAALAEKNYLNAFDFVVKQIRARGYENHITNVMVIKHLCKERRLEEAERFLNGLVRRGEELKGPEVNILVGALCETFRFERAVELAKQFGSSGLVSLNRAYGFWIKCLVRDGRVDEALEFFSQVKDSEAYFPSTVRYNVLICRLLRDNRLREVYDLLVDMNESCIPPDALTMNAVLCFFCKVGMGDVALELYDSRSEFGLSLNHMACKYLILTLCWDGAAKEAYSVLKNSLPNYFPDWRTFCTLANALCRECKIDEMKELLHLAVEHNVVPPVVMYQKYISALCRAGRLEDAYLLHGELKSVAASTSYNKMIKAFVKSGRGDIAAQLLVEMKANGHKLERRWFRAVVCCLLEMDNSRCRIFNLLDMLTCFESSCLTYNFFLDAAVNARKPELAREVFELMQRNGIKSNLGSLFLMMKGYLVSERVSDALNLFNDVRSQGLATKKFYVTLIIGLCNSNKVEISREYLFSMVRVGLNPSLDCYEHLVRKLCSFHRYREAMDVINLSQKMGRPVSSYMGNVLLYHSLISPQLYNTCLYLREVGKGLFSCYSALCMMIAAFSGRLRVSHNIADLERLIEQCFPLNTGTYNLLLRQVATSDMDKARLLFARMCQRGYQPNSFTYDIMIRGFSFHGRKYEARRWLEEMYKKGFKEKYK